MSVDSKLKDWAARHAASQTHLDALATRVVTEAARRRLSSVGPLRPAPHFLVSLGYAVTGAIVAGLVLIFCLQRGDPRDAADGALAATRLSLPTPGQFSTISRLFSETARLFPGRLRWIAQSNGDVGLGVEAAEEAWIADTPPMLVRLVVVSRTGRQADWKTAWASEVVVRGEDLAEIAPNRNSANKLILWVYPLQNGKMAVDTAVELDQPLRIASRLNSVVQAGEPVEVTTVRKGDTEYRLFQTVEPLSGRRDLGS